MLDILRCRASGDCPLCRSGPSEKSQGLRLNRESSPAFSLLTPVSSGRRPGSPTVMTLASLNYRPFPPLRPPLLPLSSQSHHSITFYLRATPPHDSSIFLPHLHLQRQQQDPPREADPNDSDPIVRFFRTRSSSPESDPPVESKLSLQPNRRSSWRLSPTIRSEPQPLDPEPQTKTPSGGQTPPAADGDDLSGTVAGEVMRIAQELPENVTIGEALEGFRGGKKLTEWECLEVLQLMEKQGMVGCALYFFEWMRMQVPSPVSGKACSVVFGMLGRAGMGKVILVLFRNLPLNVKPELRDVRLYNSAISGLMTSGW